MDDEEFAQLYICPPRRFSLIIPLVVVGLIVTLGSMSAIVLRSREEAIPAQDHGLLIDPGNLDLGEIWEDSKFIRVLSLKNSSSDDVQIEGFSGSCGLRTGRTKYSAPSAWGDSGSTSLAGSVFPFAKSSGH